MNWEQRYKKLLNIKGVSKVIPQHEWDYSNNIKKLRPNFFIHGDDWKSTKSYDFSLRKKIIKTLKNINCKMIEIPHTKNISSSLIFDKMKFANKDISNRTNVLKRIIESKKICRIIETHSPLSALIAEKINYREKDGQIVEFDGFWSSSLTDSTLKGKPDIEVLKN